MNTELEGVRGRSETLNRLVSFPLVPRQHLLHLMSRGHMSLGWGGPIGTNFGYKSSCYIPRREDRLAASDLLFARHRHLRLISRRSHSTCHSYDFSRYICMTWVGTRKHRFPRAAKGNTTGTPAVHAGAGSISVRMHAATYRRDD